MCIRFQFMNVTWEWKSIERTDCLVQRPWQSIERIATIVNVKTEREIIKLSATERAHAHAHTTSHIYWVVQGIENSNYWYLNSINNLHAENNIWNWVDINWAHLLAVSQSVSESGSLPARPAHLIIYMYFDLFWFFVSSIKSNFPLLGKRANATCFPIVIYTYTFFVYFFIFPFSHFHRGF